MLPVINIEEQEHRKKLAEIITKRIDFDTFFDSEDVLDFLVQKSGGVIRQLLRLTSFCLLYSMNQKLEISEVKEMVKEYGRQMYETLDGSQIKLLKDFKTGKRKFRPANKSDQTLLLNLFVLKYNGKYAINPVLQEWI
jgi:chromosomal replication initiation ATPase DnaA